MEYKMFDWPFFLLLCATGLASYCAVKLNKVYRSTDSRHYFVGLPPIACGPITSLIITLINLLLSWSSLAVLIYGFFILPWNVVLICAVAVLIAGSLCHLALRRLLGGFFNPFTAVLVSWAILFVVVIWYFWSRIFKDQLA
jgi:hypothetical protein